MEQQSSVMTLASYSSSHVCSAASASDDEHHGPVRVSEAPLEGGFVCWARFGAIAGMRVDPDSAGRFGNSAGADLFVEEVGNGFVVELGGHGGTGLLDEADGAAQPPSRVLRIVF